MSVRVLTRKEITELKARLRLTKKVALKPQIPSNVQTIANIILALNLAGITLTTAIEVGPPAIITLTPSAPTSPNGKSYLRLSRGDWNGCSSLPHIELVSFPENFPVPSAILYIYFETIPNRIYALEISTAVDKPSLGPSWRVVTYPNQVTGVLTLFPPNMQTLTVAFQAKESSSIITLDYQTPEGTMPQYDTPYFYSCKLMLLP